MPFASILGAVAGPLIGGLLGGASGGDAKGGTQTQTSDPWVPAQDWMKQNLSTGQNLQNYYQTNPFNSQQQSAYSNLASGGDYMNRLVPSLLQQFSQPTGFDRHNPSARPSPLSFAAPDYAQNAHAYGGRMGANMPMQGDMNVGSNPFRPGGITGASPAAQPNIQQMVNDAMAQRQSQYMPPDINIGNGGGG